MSPTKVFPYGTDVCSRVQQSCTLHTLHYYLSLVPAAHHPSDGVGIVVAVVLEIPSVLL